MPTVNVNVQPAIISWALSQTSEEKLGTKLMEILSNGLMAQNVRLLIR